MGELLERVSADETAIGIAFEEMVDHTYRTDPKQLRRNYDRVH